MRRKMITVGVIVVLFLTLFVTRLEMMPAAFSGQNEEYKEVWKILNVTNPSSGWDRDVDVDVSVDPGKGVYLACSTNITRYFENSTAQMLYQGWMNWLNGTDGMPYHWGEMDWHVSNGSLTPITYDDIQHWGTMYMDTGNVPYQTFKGNAYMADSNLTRNQEDPDIISVVNWTGNKIKVLEDFRINANDTVNMVFKIVVTEPGIYTFNITATKGVTLSETRWVMGGKETLSVGKGPAYEYHTIQEAINHATSGMNIIVAVGTYNLSSPIAVNKSVNITGDTASPSNVVINAPQTGTDKDCFQVTADNVTIQGFKIQGAKDTVANWNSGVAIGNYSIPGVQNITISHNQIINCSNGIYLYGAQHITISDNKISNSTADDIGYWNGKGIEVYGEDAGADPQPYDIDILRNEICGNELFGIELNVWDMGETTDWVDMQVVIDGNKIYDNGGPLYWDGYENYSLYRGISANDWSANVTITDNEIYNHLPTNLSRFVGSSGIGIRGYAVKDWNISENDIHDNVRGVYIYGGYGDDPNSTEVVITDNDIHNGTQGIAVGEYGSGDIGYARYNNIYNNHDSTYISKGVYPYGVANLGTGTFDATYNWWGNETGPHHSVLNPKGVGDNITDGVDYKPWLVQPYAPGQLVPVAVAYVDPELVNLTAPAVGTPFTVDVKMANVTMMYGFQLTLEWNSTLLDLTSANPHVPTPWLGYDCWINQTQKASSYSLAIAPITGDAPTFNGSASVVSLTFQAIKDPIYPDNVTCILNLTDVEIGDASANPIPHLTYSGNYSCYSTKPQLILVPANPKAYKVPTQFDVNVTVKNVVNLYSFEFNLTYNQTLLKVIDVDTPPYIPVPGQKPDNGSIAVGVEGIDPTVNGTKTLATITFKVMRGFAWSKYRTSVNGTLTFKSTTLTSPDNTPILHDPVNGTYSYIPLPGDVYDMNGYVDIYDLVFVAYRFGTKPGGPPYDRADLNDDGKIDILDVILVARNFGAEV